MNSKHIIGDLHYAVPYPEEYVTALLQSQFTDRELKLILNSMDYAQDEDKQGGIPGHNLLIVIGKIMNMVFIDRDMVINAIETELDEADFFADGYEYPEEEQTESWGCDCCGEKEEEEKKPDMNMTMHIHVDATELDDFVRKLSNIVEGYYED